MSNIKSGKFGKDGNVNYFLSSLTNYAFEIVEFLVKRKGLSIQKFGSYLPELRHRANDPNDGVLKTYDCFYFKASKGWVVLAVSEDFDLLHTSVKALMKKNVEFVNCRNIKYAV